MNKKIKVIDFLNIISKGEFPKKIKYEDKIYEYKNITQGTGYVTEKYDWFNSDIYIDDCSNLNDYVEILEDNTEEIEELPIHDEDEKKYSIVVLDNRIKINELVKAINSIRKDKNND